MFCLDLHQKNKFLSWVPKMWKFTNFSDFEGDKKSKKRNWNPWHVYQLIFLVCFLFHLNLFLVCFSSSRSKHEICCVKRLKPWTTHAILFRAIRRCKISRLADAKNLELGDIFYHHACSHAKSRVYLVFTLNRINCVGFKIHKDF